MELMEKVIKCLEACGDEEKGCADCPYRHIPLCIAEMRKDALIVIKQLKNEQSRN